MKRTASNHQTANDPEVLEMALSGFALKRANIEHEIERVLVMLKHDILHGPEVAHEEKNKHRISAAGRARIAAATKKRWARYRREQAKAGGRE